jgi:hypothetical protein
VRPDVIGVGLLSRVVTSDSALCKSTVTPVEPEDANQSMDANGLVF